MVRMWKKLKGYADITARYCDMQMPVNPRETDVETSVGMRGGAVAASAAIRVWLPAAFKFPAKSKHRISEALMKTVDWYALLRHSAHNQQLQECAKPLVLSLLAHEDLRDSFSKTYGRQFVQGLFCVYRISGQQLRSLQLPAAIQEELLGWLKDAIKTAASCSRCMQASASINNGQAGASQSISDAAVHMGVKQQGTTSEAGVWDGGSGSYAAAGDNTGVNSEAGDMQELLEMMYAIANLG